MADDGGSPFERKMICDVIPSKMSLIFIAYFISIILRVLHVNSAENPSKLSIQFHRDVANKIQWKFDTLTFYMLSKNQY